MKKVILSIIIASLGFMATHAQNYCIGGSLAFSNYFSKMDIVDSHTHPSYSLSIAPEIGYSINDKTAIGLSVSTTLSSSKTPIMRIDISGLRVGGVYKSTGKIFEIAPYIRYSVFKRGKFDLLGMASVYVNTGKTESNSVYDYSYGAESGNLNRTKIFTWGANIHPVLLYNFSDRIAFLAHLNFFSLDFWWEQQKNTYNLDDNESTNTITGYNLGLDTNNVLPAIGFIYKF